MCSSYLFGVHFFALDGARASRFRPRSMFVQRRRKMAQIHRTSILFLCCCMASCSSCSDEVFKSDASSSGQIFDSGQEGPKKRRRRARLAFDELRQSGPAKTVAIIGTSAGRWSTLPKHSPIRRQLEQSVTAEQDTAENLLLGLVVFCTHRLSSSHDSPTQDKR